MTERIKTTKKDIIWNYIGTAASMASGFVLLPILIRYLTSDELGLWYVLVAISNFASMFEFGFNPTFARNIVYVMSGAQSLKSNNAHEASNVSHINWHLLNVLIVTAKKVYSTIAVVGIIGLAIFGSIYIRYITAGMDGRVVWVSWAVFCAAIFINIYFLYSITLLRGYGDVEGENKAKTASRIIQLLVSAVLLLCGAGLIGASIGYLANGVFLRVFAGMRLRKHEEVERGRREDGDQPTKNEIKETLGDIGGIAWRDGFVQIACYASTQAMSIVGSLAVGLSETGSYSVLLQLGTAVYNFASAYPKSFYPAFQAAFASKDRNKEIKIVSKCIKTYWGLFVFGTLGVILVVFPILPIIKPEFVPNIRLFLLMSVYLALWQHHSMACNFIIGMNEIPYVKGYVTAAIAGVLLSFVLSAHVGLGEWGLVIGQAIPQALYNNWKWPVYLAHKLKATYFALLVA